MHATYRLMADDLTDDFIKKIKKFYQGKEIEISVHEMQDETEYLLSSEENKKQLLNAIAVGEKGQTYRNLDIDELEAMVQ